MVRDELARELVERGREGSGQPGPAGQPTRGVREARVVEDGCRKGTGREQASASEGEVMAQEHGDCYGWC